MSASSILDDIDHWISMLNDPSVRGQATHRLAALGQAAVARLGSAAAGSWTNRYGASCANDLQIRGGAVIALRMLGPAAAEAVPVLAELLAHPSPSLRREAALALGAVGPVAASARPALETLAHDGDPEVRTEAHAALARIGPR
jgi:hypothetical protein